MHVKHSHSLLLILQTVQRLVVGSVTENTVFLTREMSSAMPDDRPMTLAEQRWKSRTTS